MKKFGKLSRVRCGHVLALFALAILILRPSRAIAADAETRLAIVLGNNGSATLGRAELRYADDDAAKYVSLLGGGTHEGDVELLARMDADTARLFPARAQSATPPTRAALEAAVARTVQRARAAVSRGERVVFTFVFAGHGDVEDGRGFLELEDGRFFREDLESMLQRIPATRAHVVLDACNSVYMLASRKPGGTRFATPEDVERSMRARLAHVGTFLSTSADAQVYEWSQIESGVFSHAVRSGLSGAADLNADGRITYGELRAFVRVAAAGIPNPRFRPRIYARGPDGRDDEVLFDARAPGARQKLTLGQGGERRVTVLDANEVPLVDARLESGFAPNLYLPAGDGFTLVEREAGTPERRARLARSEGSVDLLARVEAQPAPSARGSRSFELLFAVGFGPRAAAALPPEKPDEEVYGVSMDDRERMGRLLDAAAEMQHDRRIGSAVGLGAGGLIFAGVGTALLVTNRTGEVAEGDKPTGAVLLGVGAVSLGFAALQLATTSGLEDRRVAYKAALRSRPDAYDVAVRDAERELLARAKAQRNGRIAVSVLSFALAGIGLGAGITLEATADNDQTRLAARFLMAGGAGYALLGGGILAIRSEEERLADLWKQERAIPKNTASSFQWKPLIGAGSVGIGGTF